MIEIEKNSKIYQIEGFYHLTHIDNLVNIIRNGILSHNEAISKGLLKKDISMTEIQQRRDTKLISGTKYYLHDCASLYFQIKNRMLHIYRGESQKNILILVVKPEILYSTNVFFTDGNAANKVTYFNDKPQNLKWIDLERILAPKYFGTSKWNQQLNDDEREYRRIRCAEVLVYPKVEIKDIIKIICFDEEEYSRVYEITSESDLIKISAHIKVEIDFEKKYYF